MAQQPLGIGQLILCQMPAHGWHQDCRYPVRTSPQQGGQQNRIGAPKVDRGADRAPRSGSPASWLRAGQLRSTVSLASGGGNSPAPPATAVRRSACRQTRSCRRPCTAHVPTATPALMGHDRQIQDAIPRGSAGWRCSRPSPASAHPSAPAGKGWRAAQHVHQFGAAAKPAMSSDEWVWNGITNSLNEGNGRPVVACPVDQMEWNGMDEWKDWTWTEWKEWKHLEWGLQLFGIAGNRLPCCPDRHRKRRRTSRRSRPVAGGRWGRIIDHQH